MQQGIQERLAELLRRHALSGRGLARATGESDSNVSRWLKDGSAPTAFLIACEQAGLARAAWLLTGEGSPDVSESEAQTILEQVRALVLPPARSPSADASLDPDEDAAEAEATSRPSDPRDRRRGAGGGGRS